VLTKIDKLSVIQDASTVEALLSSDQVVIEDELAVNGAVI
jgi:hypothetical protein